MTDKKQKIQIEGHKLMYHVDEVSRWLKGEIVAPPYVEIGLFSWLHTTHFGGSWGG